jgi:hypothetical protein
MIKKQEARGIVTLKAREKPKKGKSSVLVYFIKKMIVLWP